DGIRDFHVTGVQTCALPISCMGTQVVDTQPPDVLTPKQPQTPIHAPIAAVMAKSVFTPDPDPSTLARTPTGRTHRSPGRTTVSRSEERREGKKCAFRHTYRQ